MKKILQKFIKQPFFRKLGFFERVKALSCSDPKAQAQELFNSLATRQFDGCSFVHSTVCLAMKPSPEELKQHFEELKLEVINFFDTLTSYFPNSHTISLEESMSFSKVIAAKTMVTLYDDLYFVYSVVLLRKNSDGTWQTITEIPSSFNYSCQSHNPHIFKEFPKSITICFCGGFGDVNYVDQEDFKHHSDFFFAL